MTTIYTYKWTACEDLSKPDNNYGCETETMTTQDGYEFGDVLNDRGLAFEQDGNTYYILDDCGDRTGEAYLIISETTEG